MLAGSNVIRVIQRDPGAGNTRSCSPPSCDSLSESESGLSMSCDPCDPGDPSSSGAKQRNIPPQRRWIFTWFGYPENWDTYFSVHRAPEGKLHGYMGEREICPTTERPHIQGWMDFGEGRKGRPFSLKLPKELSFRKMRGSPESNFRYCSKEDEEYIAWGTCMKAKPFEIEIDFSKSRDKWMQRAFNILEPEPHNRHCWWLWEPVGRAGKTLFCKWYVSAYKDTLVLEGSAHDMKNGIVQWRAKHESCPRVILINIPRSKKQEHISWGGIEQIKDMIFFSGKYEGGMINDKHPHVIFFANWEPEKEHLSGDRWRIIRIPDGEGEGLPFYDDWRAKEPTIEECVRLVPAKFPGFVVPEEDVPDFSDI